LGEGRSISDFSCWGIFVLLNISLSRVKEIVEKFVIEFQNGNEWVEDWIGQGLGRPVTPGGLASRSSAQNAEEWGTPLYV
jgi:hypothetical protein